MRDATSLLVDWYRRFLAVTLDAAESSGCVAVNRQWFASNHRQIFA